MGGLVLVVGERGTTQGGLAGNGERRTKNEERGKDQGQTPEIKSPVENKAELIGQSRSEARH
jgi:hypothetical protein